MLDQLTAYMVSIAPSLVSVASLIGIAFSVIRAFKKATKDQTTDVASMRRESKQLNSSIKELVEENRELAEAIKNQSKEIKSMQGQLEVLRDVKEERLQQEITNKDLDR